MVEFYLLMMLAGLFVLAMSARWVLGNLSEFARKIGISQFSAGLILAFGTSVPEFMNSVFASFLQKGDFVLGNLIGSSMSDTAFVLGVMALLAGYIRVNTNNMHKSEFPVFLVLLLPIVLALDGSFSMIDGLLFIGAFLVSLKLNWENHGYGNHFVRDVNFDEIRWDIISISLGIAMIAGSAYIVVFYSSLLSAETTIPLFLISSTIVAIGTTLPELTVSVLSFCRGCYPIGFGTVFGSVILNLSLTLGTACLISPITIDSSIFFSSFLFVIFAGILAFYFMKTDRVLERKEGILMILLFILFLLYQTQSLWM